MNAFTDVLTGVIRSRKGSAMVEAAILYPLILLVLAALVSILVQFYGEAGQLAGMHRLLLGESGAATGNYQSAETLPEVDGVQTMLGVFGLHPVRAGNAVVERKGFGLLAAPPPLRVQGRSYLLDEQAYLMLKALGKEVADFAAQKP